MRRHASEKIFSVPIAGGFANDMERVGALLEEIG